MGAACSVFVVQAVLFNVFDDGLRDEISDAHVALAEKTNLRAGNVVLHELLNDMDILLPLLESGKCLIDVGSGSLRVELDDNCGTGTGRDFCDDTSMIKAPKLLRM